MQLHLKTFKFLKIKKYFKKSSFLFIFNTVVSKNTSIQTQNLKTLNLTHYKLYNTLTKKILRSSIYENYHSSMQGVILSIKPKKSISLSCLDKNLSLVGVKLNNKIYLLSEVNDSIRFDYSKDFMFGIITLKDSLKFTKNFETM